MIPEYFPGFDGHSASVVEECDEYAALMFVLPGGYSWCNRVHATRGLMRKLRPSQGWFLKSGTLGIWFVSL